MSFHVAPGEGHKKNEPRWLEVQVTLYPTSNPEPGSLPASKSHAMHLDHLKAF